MQPRKPIGNVVVATDFSRHADEAIARAAVLPLAPGAGITVVHAVPRGLRPDLAKRWREAVEVMMRNLELSLAARRQPHGATGVEVAIVVETGRAAEVVAEQARRKNAEIVIVGRGARSGPGPRFLGSTAERIVRGCECSVLVVAAEPKGGYARPLVAVDLSEVSRREIEMGVRVAPTVPTLDVLHAFAIPYSTMLREGGLSGRDFDLYSSALADASRSGLAELVERSGDLEVPLIPIIREGDPRRVILTEAAVRNADVVILGAHESSAIERFILGSVAQSIVRLCERDVLVVR